MECNKEEATRAREIANEKMQSGDFLAAEKIALRAQKLFPELENISQLLAVCQIHCSAKIKIYGSEMDWYAILQTDKGADDATIKKQYRKLALLLHPDKNKFSGAEAAFKLIGEAHRVLSDQTRRSTYDMKCKAPARNIVSKPPASQSNKNTCINKSHGGQKMQKNTPNVCKPQFASFNSQSGQQTFPNGRDTFWTCCPFCSIRYQYYRDVVNRALRCQSCQKPFIAYDIGAQGPPPASTGNQPPHSQQKGIPSATVFSGAGVNHSAGLEESYKARTACPSTSAVGGAFAGVAVGSSTEKKGNGHVNAGLKKEGVGSPKYDASNSRKSATPRSTSRKRGRKMVLESSDSSGGASSIDADDEFTGKNVSSGSARDGSHHTRRSSRQRHNVSYDESSSEDEFVSFPRRKKDRRTSTTSGEGIKEEDGIEEEANTFGKGETQKARTVGDKQVDENFEVDDDPEDISHTEPEVFSYPDPDFSDFDKDKAKDRFETNQLWAIYDTIDGMPRFYARVTKVFRGEFKLQITWLEAAPLSEMEWKWADMDLPVSCGRFKRGKVQTTSDLLMFSHVVDKWTGYPCFIYPKKGETWALFKDWDLAWSSEPENHKTFKFEIVEILTDLDDDLGIGVAYLHKVKGFVSLFQQSTSNRVVSFIIPCAELFRFSHRVPSYKMSGTEGDGVPEGSFELDPVSLPTDTDQFLDHIDMKTDSVENKKPSTHCKDNQGNASTIKEESNKGFGANVHVNTPIGKEINDVEKDALKAKSSPRASSCKKSSQGDFNRCPSPDKPNKPLDVGKEKSCNIPHQTTAGASYVKMAKPHDFNADKCKDKFAPGQIWALYSGRDRLPRSYAQIKRIESNPDFRLHVSLLEACLPPKGSNQPVSCGAFKLDHATKPLTVPHSEVSHLVRADSLAKNRFEILPGNGEVWAMYKSRNGKPVSADKNGEYDIVEVLEGGVEHQVVKVLLLVQVTGYKFVYRGPRRQRSNTGVIEVPRSELHRFSHRIPAYKYSGEEDFSLADCWELDPSSFPGTVICLD